MASLITQCDVQVRRSKVNLPFCTSRKAMTTDTGLLNQKLYILVWQLGLGI